jgi:spermidine synthase
MPYLLLLSVFVIATCGLIYELIAGTLASYLLGDSVTQFSTIIGAYLFSMGIGSFFSKFFKTNLVPLFIRVELLIGLIGGFSAAVLFLSFEYTTGFRFLLYGQVALTGILVGLEIPLLMRIMQDRFSFKDLVSNIFTFDYIGALAASILFPMVLVPQLGLLRTGFFFGLLNTAIAIWGIYLFRDQLKNSRFLRIPAFLVAAALILGFIGSGSITKAGENAAFPGSIIFAKSTPYQRIILTRQKDDLRLFLNGNLQFSSRDEYRYHEALVHPPMASARHHGKVLVMGGGDGLAVREILKYPDVDSILLVDLDPEMTRMFSHREDLARLNHESFSNPKVRVINADAFRWVREADSAKWDVAIIDFPDPSNFSIGKLYSQTFYAELRRILKPDGVAVIQSTSPYFAPKSFWCIERTVAATGFETVPYHCYVPSFGEWGYVMISAQPLPPNLKLPEGLRFFNTETFRQMVQFPPDMMANPEEINKLNNQALVQYFEKEWGRYTD